MCEDCELETVPADKEDWGPEAFPDAATAMFGDLNDVKDE